METLRFQALWTTQNCHLQSSIFGIWNSTHLSTWEKITTVFLRYIELISGYICPKSFSQKAKEKIMSLPVQRAVIENRRASWIANWNTEGSQSLPGWRRIQERFTPYQLQLTSPDAAPNAGDVRGFFYRHNAADKNQVDVPTIICFDRVVANEAIWNWLLVTGCHSSEPFNVITLDYPTENINSSRDLIKHGETLYQMAHDRLGISERNIHFLGCGFGGPLAALVSEMHPDAGRLVSFKSFASMESLIWHEAALAIERQGFIAFLTKWIISKLNTAIGWGWEATNALWKVKDKALFLYSAERDQNVPFHVNAINAIGAKNLQENQCIFMRRNLGNALFADDDYQHFISPYSDQQNTPIAIRIVNFIFGREMLKWHEGDSGRIDMPDFKERDMAQYRSKLPNRKKLADAWS